MYLKNVEIHWSHLDANRHVANSTYSDFLSETRMSCLREGGFTQKEFIKNQIGPVIFSEEFYYIKEIYHGEKVKVGLELLAHSPTYKYMKFAHTLFNTKNELSLYSETFFGWFDLRERKLGQPPKLVIDIFSQLSKADNFHELSDEINLKNSKIPFDKKISNNVHQ